MSLQSDIARLFGDAYGAGEISGRGAWTPFLDVYETPESFVVKVDLPGLNPNDVDVTLDQNLLTISGERKATNEVKEENYHRVERRYGSFQRTVSLPAHVDADAIQASFNGGVLEITVPKSEQAKPRKIKVGEAKQLDA
jgi:HSP20 family protein